MKNIARRSFCKKFGLALASSLVLPVHGQSNTPGELIKTVVPASGEKLTAIGMGTWQTFNVGSDLELRNDRTKVLQTFYQMGGQMIDSSPMYGSSQEVVGYALKQLKYPSGLFTAEKIWTRDGKATREQAIENAGKWGVKHFDLLQVHNLLSWPAHIEHLREMKQRGELRYIGMTTSHGRRHSDLEKIMQMHELDFIQLTYNLEDREAQKRLLPLAKERGIAVIVNRPFQGGRLIDRLQNMGAPLPRWAQEYHCTNWSQFLLKYIISHPAVTCAIPATSNVAHMQENMGAATGPLPNANVRQNMFNYVASL